MIVIAATKAWQPVKVTSDTELSLLKSKIAETKMQLKQEKAGSLQVDGGVSVTVIYWLLFTLVDTFCTGTTLKCDRAPFSNDQPINAYFIVGS